MRKQTRPFAVEIKRTKGSRQPSPFLDLPKEPAAPSGESRQASAALLLSPSEPAGSAPRILESTAPGWSPPPAPEAARPKRGRPPKARTQTAAEALATEDVEPAEHPSADADEALTTVAGIEAGEIVDDDLAEDDLSEAAEDFSGTGDEAPVAIVARRRPRRAVEGHIGNRWKRHLPRWKR
ncbi:hypothetical protein [Jiella avicenniae]|uniref:Uncharacterized protein n=1 Tax=Jiella avicenniae TaxID=2907202 RepID=A0A9X1P7A2_9HYPH|nr:hypothetical protein [Jiella avicenniae]MCE7030588.1 hypothetical protein [Jiella avicenniae]